MAFDPEPATAAVAIIRSTAGGESYLILRRATHPRDPWSGHYSFPGGRRDLGDHDLLTTCLRETCEETGIVLSAKQLLRELPETPAGHRLHRPLWVQPFLFNLAERPPLRLDTREIQGAVWLDAEDFLDPGRHCRAEMLPGQLFPAFPLQEYYLWGFTYRLLCSILGIEAQAVLPATTVSRQ